MDADALIDRLAAEGPLLAAAAERAEWDAPVPGCPGWTVRDLVTHTGGVHRWAADLVATESPTAETELNRAVGSGSPDDELLAWFRTGHATLVATLRAAPDVLRCVTFLPADSPRHFWARRQAHETAIHRADAEAATGAVASFPAEFAQDGIAEMLLGFAARRRKPLERGATLALDVTDGPSWRVELGGDQVRAEPAESLGDGDADATVRGTSAELYRWLWNRPSAAVVSGDQAAAALWARAVRVRWS
jgi:uncharacterized protein (TIGR03083 family)